MPNSWQWVRLGTIFEHNTGKALNSSNTEGVMLTYITTSNLYWDRFEFDSIKEMPFTDAEIEKCTVKKGDLLVCEGGDIGRSAIWCYDNEIRIQNHIHRLRSYISLSNRFYYYVLYLWKIQERIGGQGIGLQGLSSKALHKILVPLPTINEQQNIVDKLDYIFDCISDLDIQKDDFISLVDLVKSKILDLAIRGKLVPQDPNDEPASVLLERIRAEKEELIKSGKIKRDKKESVIFKGEDNSYYENLPSNWALTSLGMISKVITKGTTPRGGNVSYTSSGIGFLRAENILGYDKLNLDNLKYVDDKTHTGFLKRSILESNDILITIAGTLGRTAIVTESALPLNTNQAVALVRLVTTKFVNIKYLIYAINSSKIKKDLLHQEVAMAIPNLSLENIYDCKIPLPPIEEQNRISEVIDKIFVVLDIIEQSLN
ncbi:type I restriction enzyme, S subunit [Peptoniphilus asaccharolyticus DSM 20463]|uniref:Type I restriction enzyme, S subunit n=1 Tax=Peptoniphilus asaccharolyticus DSM 20463 TaxID=573058 RepID=A0A1W1V376_PEPAS|nr:restriction endonuclease subunit S [Peptoniphilus asaccharolyticus]MBL7576192.1 restriction endonuclease subunit S [Peptoniphilus asaccharolyticus]SMB87782.1 type I restriction enzyme, S subunit [Peptoniphilus asaccharolyticus DSM 20463]